MAPQTTGDTTAMRLAAQTFGDTIANGEAMLKAVTTAAEGMPWQGPTAQKYVEIIYLWEKKFVEVIHSLAEMQDTLNGSAAHYDANEEANNKGLSDLQLILDGIK